MTELASIQSRLNFQRHQSENVPAEWRHGSGVEKELICRLRLWQVSGKTVLVDPSPRLPPLFETGLVRSLSRASTFHAKESSRLNGMFDLIILVKHSAVMMVINADYI